MLNYLEINLTLPNSDWDDMEINLERRLEQTKIRIAVPDGGSNGSNVSAVTLTLDELRNVLAFAEKYEAAKQMFEA